MRDPLVNELHETVYGLRCMLAVKYLQLVEKTYDRGTLGRGLIREFISVIRARNYVEVSSRYNHLHVRFEGTPSYQLGHPICEPCCCPHCPGHQSKGMGQQTPVPEAQEVQDVQKPRCP
nr:pre-coat protein [Papaya leaf curl Bagalkote virus]